MEVPLILSIVTSWGFLIKCPTTNFWHIWSTRLSRRMDQRFPTGPSTTCRYIGNTIWLEKCVEWDTPRIGAWTLVICSIHQLFTKPTSTWMLSVLIRRRQETFQTYIYGLLKIVSTSRWTSIILLVGPKSHFLNKLHPDKCKLMRICSKNSQIPAFDYTLGSTGNNIRT